MKPREFLRELQEADHSNLSQSNSSTYSILKEIQKILVPYVGDSMLQRLRTEFPDLAEKVGNAHLTEIVDRVMSDQSGMTKDIQTPQNIFDEFVVAMSSAFSAAQLNSDEFRELVAIGFRPTSEVNARARQVPDGSGFVIEVNEGLWWFISAFSKIHALSTQAQGDDAPLLSNDKRRMVLVELLDVYRQAPALLRDVASMHLRDFRQEAFAQRLAKHMKQFAVAHELGHIMMGHLWKGKERAQQRSLPVGALLPTDWEEEHEADGVGVGIIFHATEKSADRNNEAPWSYLGADAFFGTLNIIERKWRLQPTSHPPSLLRRQRLRSHVRENFPGAVEAVMQRAEPFGKLLDNWASDVTRAS